MYGGKVHSVTPTGAVETVLDLGAGTPSGLGFMPNGDLLVVSMFERVLLRVGAPGVIRHADLSPLAPHSINDMVVDGEGRAYVGQSGFDYCAGEAPRPAPLIGAIFVAAPDLTVGNGVVITGDGRRLIVAETLGHRISVFDIDGAGRLSNRRVFAALPDRHMPDGICLDTDGASGSPARAGSASSASRTAAGSPISCRCRTRTAPMPACSAARTGAPCSSAARKPPTRRRRRGCAPHAS